jgi:hypothetical protein
MPGARRETGPIPFAEYLARLNAERAADASASSGERTTSRGVSTGEQHDWPRLGDVAPVEKPQITRRVEQTYQARGVDPSRGLIDILM